MKKAANSQTKYFNCSIQTNDTVVRAVCFNPDSLEQLVEVKAKLTRLTAVKTQNMYNRFGQPLLKQEAILFT